MAQASLARRAGKPLRQRQHDALDRETAGLGRQGPAVGIAFIRFRQQPHRGRLLALPPVLLGVFITPAQCLGVAAGWRLRRRLPRRHLHGQQRDAKRRQPLHKANKANKAMQRLRCMNHADHAWESGAAVTLHTASDSRLTMRARGKAVEDRALRLDGRMAFSSRWILRKARSAKCRQVGPGWLEPGRWVDYPAGSCSCVCTRFPFHGKDRVCNPAGARYPCRAQRLRPARFMARFMTFTRHGRRHIAVRAG